MTYQTKINYLFIGYVLLEATLHKVLFAFDGASRIPMFLLFVSLLSNLSDNSFKSTLFSTPVRIWLIWSLYALTCWITIGLYDSETPKLTFISQNFVLPLFVMSVTCLECTKDMKRTASFLVCIYFIILFLGLTLQGHTTRDDSASWEGRQGALLGNTLPLNCYVLMCISAFAYIKKWIKGKYFLLILGLCIAATLLVATRKVLGAMSIFIIFLSLTRINYRNPSSLIKLGLYAVVFYVLYHFVMSHTLVGARMGDIDDVAEKYNIVNNPYLNWLGDRAIQYILGWDLFLDHPIFGIGIHNFQTVADFSVRLHTEYMVQICECGLVGFVLYLAFVRELLLKPLFIFKSGDDAVAFVFWGAMAGLLFMSFTTWTYSAVRYFPIYGIIFAYNKMNNLNIQK